MNCSPLTTAIFIASRGVVCVRVSKWIEIYPVVGKKERLRGDATENWAAKRWCGTQREVEHGCLGGEQTHKPWLMARKRQRTRQCLHSQTEQTQLHHLTIGRTSTHCLFHSVPSRQSASTPSAHRWLTIWVICWCGLQHCLSLWPLAQYQSLL